MTVAHVYSKALFEAARDIKFSEEQLNALESEIHDFSKLLSTHSDLLFALTSAATTPREKSGVIQALLEKLNYSPLFSRFLLLTAKKGRLSILQDFAEAFHATRLQAGGGVVGVLESAESLEASDIQALSQAFSQKLGKKVDFRATVNSNLLAGVKVTVNGVTYDGTLRSQLQRLREQVVYNTSSVR